MAVIVKGYNPHKTTGQDYYLHYWAKHASPAIRAAGNKANQTEQEILSKTKEKIWKAKAVQAQQLMQYYGNDQQTLTDIEYIISGKYLEDLKLNIEQSASTIQPLPFEEVLGISPEALIADAESAMEQSSSFRDSLKQEILDQIGMTPAQADEYYELVKEYFLGTKGKYNGPKWTDLQTTIINALLAREGQGLFSKGKALYKQKFAHLNGDQAKLIVAMKLLENPNNFTQYIKTAEQEGMTIKHGDGSEKVSKDKLELITELFTKILKWRDQGNAIAAEAASGAGAEAALQKASNAFENMETQLSGKKGTSNFSVTKDFSGTKALFDLVGKDAYKRASTKRVGKSDNILEISFGEDGGKITLQQGITVKNYRTVDINKTEQSANIQLQSGTPLLTLLAREAQFSMEDIYNLIQVGTAFGTEGDYNSGLVKIWNKTIQNAKYLAFLDTLAGFTNEEDRAFYMIFNGKIYDIIDILEYIETINNPNTINWSVIDGDNSGLERITYLAMNKWIAPNDKNNPISAEERSGRLLSNAAQKMYETKIKVKLHIAQLGALVSLNK